MLTLAYILKIQSYTTRHNCTVIVTGLHLSHKFAWPSCW